MTDVFRSIIVICEGKSEDSYIRKLNVLAPFGQSFYSGARRMMLPFGGGGYGSPWQGTQLRSPLVPGAMQVSDDRFRRYGRSGFVSKFRF